MVCVKSVSWAHKKRKNKTRINMLFYCTKTPLHQYYYTKSSSQVYLVQKLSFFKFIFTSKQELDFSWIEEMVLAQYLCVC